MVPSTTLNCTSMKSGIRARSLPGVAPRPKHFVATTKSYQPITHISPAIPLITEPTATPLPPTGLSAQTQGYSHFGRAYRSDLCRTRELAADDVHHRSGLRFSIIQQAGGCLRRSRHFDHAGHYNPVLCRGTPTVGLASVNGRHADRYLRLR